MIDDKPRTALPFARAGRILLGTAMLACLYACQSAPSRVEQTIRAPSPMSETQGQARWTYLRFRLARDRTGEVDSYLDALIADQILSGAIAREANEILLWRFHRRWPDDPTGHQFSFIFFARPMVADRLIARVRADPVLDRLREEGHLADFRVDRTSPELGAAAGATSDPSWPPAIQLEWPKFIMGASRMWLGLVQSEAAKHAELELHERYQAVETALDELWFEQANHAFFHHLSALFGYQPVRVIRRDIMTF
jgi:hypothetical protein